MDRLDSMRAFVTVAEEEGFAAAARRLAISPPAITRAITALEERIGTRLLHRTTRVVRLTEAGHRFFDECKRILGEIEDAEAFAAGAHSEPRGQLVVTAPVTFGRMYVAPILFDFLARHPAVTVRTMFLDRVVNLVDEGIDVAIRIAHLPDSSLTAIPVGSVRFVACASPHFLAAHGALRHPNGLARLPVIGFSHNASAESWTFADGSKPGSVAPTAQLLVNNADVAVAAAVAGLGVARVLSYQVAPELAAGRLEIVLSDFEPASIPVNLVFAEGRKAAAKVRAFVDFAVQRLRSEKCLEQPRGGKVNHSTRA